MIRFNPTIRTSARHNGYGNLLFADTHQYLCGHFHYSVLYDYRLMTFLTVPSALRTMFNPVPTTGRLTPDGE